MKAKREREQAMSAVDSDIVLTCLMCSDEEEDKKKDVGDDESKVGLTVMSELDDLALRSIDTRREFSQIFIADTGASGHMSGST